MAKIILKRQGEVVHRESKAFDRRPPAAAWIVGREDELQRPGAIDRASRPSVTLADAIDRYTTDSRKEIGRTKAQVLRSLKTYAAAALPCDRVASHDIVALAQELARGRSPPRPPGLQRGSSGHRQAPI